MLLGKQKEEAYERQYLTLELGWWLSKFHIKVVAPIIMDSNHEVLLRKAEMDS